MEPDVGRIIANTDIEKVLFIIWQKRVNRLDDEFVLHFLGMYFVRPQETLDDVRDIYRVFFGILITNNSAAAVEPYINRRAYSWAIDMSDAEVDWDLEGQETPENAETHIFMLFMCHRRLILRRSWDEIWLESRDVFHERRNLKTVVSTAFERHPYYKHDANKRRIIRDLQALQAPWLTPQQKLDLHRAGELQIREGLERLDGVANLLLQEHFLFIYHRQHVMGLTRTAAFREFRFWFPHDRAVTLRSLGRTLSRKYHTHEAREAARVGNMAEINREGYLWAMTPSLDTVREIWEG